MLVIDKPRGPSSADVVARVRRILGLREVGHTGTLDPMASGVLPLVLGEATKIAGAIIAHDKDYDGELELGLTTDTLDAEGQVLARAPWEQVTREQVEAGMAALTGQLMQVPPMHAAIKQGGVKLYQLAHQGLEVERAARPVLVEAFRLTGWQPPRATFSVRCGSGTYVRALVRDLGQALGPGATLTMLRRTRVGGFALAQAITLERLQAGDPLPLIPPVAALAGVQKWQLDTREAERVRQGQRLKIPESLAPGDVCLVDPAGDVAALGRVEPVITEPGFRLIFTRIFASGRGRAG